VTICEHCGQAVEQGVEAVQLFNGMYLHKICFEEDKRDLVQGYLVRAKGIYDDVHGLGRNPEFLRPPKGIEEDLLGDLCVTLAMLSTDEMEEKHKGTLDIIRNNYETYRERLDL